MVAVQGCRDPDLPDGTWIRRYADEALVGCKAGSQVTWLLECVEGTWRGQVGICSASGANGAAPDSTFEAGKEVLVPLSPPLSAKRDEG